MSEKNHLDLNLDFFDKDPTNLVGSDNNAIFALSDKVYYLYRLEKYIEAITYCDKTLESNPNNLIMLCCKGICLFRLKRYDEVIICLDKHLETDPDDIFMLKMKGLIMFYKVLGVRPDFRNNINLLKGGACIRDSLQSLAKENQLKSDKSGEEQSIKTNIMMAWTMILEDQ